ncbi:MAG: CRISPR-associated protein Cas4 [Anaerolineae bacterium]
MAAKETVEATLFTVTDLKQYTYCPRVVYYTYCLPLLRPETYKMEESQKAHEEETQREQRRSLRVYGLPEGTFAFDVTLRSEALGLTGRVDAVIRTADEQIPVDYKNSDRPPGPHFRLQVAAYGLMLEEIDHRPVRRGFLYAIPLRKANEVTINAAMRGRVGTAVKAMRAMVEREAMPEPPASRSRCVACEFRRFCNDL